MRTSWLIGLSLCLTTPVLAQGGGSNPNLIMGGYKAPSRAHRHDCYVQILTRNIVLDANQRAAVNRIITQYMDSQPIPPTSNRTAWLARDDKRNSEILSLLITKADSDRFEDNRKREHAWFASGVCHG